MRVFFMQCQKKRSKDAATATWFDGMFAHWLELTKLKLKYLNLLLYETTSDLSNIYGIQMEFKWDYHPEDKKNMRLINELDLNFLRWINLMWKW